MENAGGKRGQELKERIKEIYEESICKMRAKGKIGRVLDG